jgi:hypothetical protein
MSVEMGLFGYITLFWDCKVAQDTFNTYKTMAASYQSLPFNAIIQLIDHHFQELWAKGILLYKQICYCEMSLAYDCYSLTKPIWRNQSLTGFLMGLK